jgi:hypothetical protein
LRGRDLGGFSVVVDTQCHGCGGEGLAACK